MKLDQQHSLRLGYQRKGVSGRTHVSPLCGYRGDIPAQGRLAAGRVDYLFNNAERFGYSVSPEDGSTIELGCEQLDQSIGSDFNVRKYSVDWHEYIDSLLKHHVLLLRGYQANQYRGKKSGSQRLSIVF